VLKALKMLKNNIITPFQQRSFDGVVLQEERV
jgi:hypothetical protein